MMFKVFSDGPDGPSCLEAKVSKVPSLGSRLRLEGHKNIRVGQSADDTTPFDQWINLSKGVTVESV